MARNELQHETLKELERAYEQALRYASWYNARWDRVSDLGAKLRDLHAAQDTAAHQAA